MPKSKGGALENKDAGRSQFNVFRFSQLAQKNNTPKSSNHPNERDQFKSDDDQASLKRKKSRSPSKDDSRERYRTKSDDDQASLKRKKSRSPCKDDSREGRVIESPASNKRKMKSDDKSSESGKNSMNNIRKYHFEPDSTVIILDHPSEICLQGKVHLQVLGGSVEVWGATLTDKTPQVPIYSADNNSLITVATRSPAEDLDQVNDIINKMQCSDTDLLHEWRSSVSSKSVVLKLSKLDCFVSDCIVALPSFSGIFEPDTGGGRRESFASNFQYDPSADVNLAYCHQVEHQAQVYKASDEQIRIVNEFLQLTKNKTDAAIVVCGGKNVGKSSTCRYIVNKLLSKHRSVCYLECDVGQTEFSPPGCLALHVLQEPCLGPPFTHQRKAVKMAFLGATSPGDDPMHYIRCLQVVYEAYKTLENRLPLVINTMGWPKGIGLMFLADTLRMVEPDIVVQCESDSQHRNMPLVNKDFLQETQSWWYEKDSSRKEGKHFRLYKMRSPVSSSQEQATRYRPEDHRNMSLIGHLCSSAQISALTSDEQWHPLLNLPRHQLAWSSVAIHVSHCHVPYTQLLYAINGTVVALCKVGPHKIYKKSDSSLPGYLLRSPVCLCLGLGLVTNIDPKKKLLHIISSLSHEDLKKVNLLQKGNVDIPHDFLLKQNDRTPYVGDPHDVIGATSITRRRHMLRKFNT